MGQNRGGAPEPGLDVREGFLEKVKFKQKAGTCLGAGGPKQQPGEAGRIF